MNTMLCVHQARILIAVHLLVLLADLVCSSVTSYDVVVYTSTPAGVAAAIAAKVSGAEKVLLLEPTAYVGGMASPGGIGLRDCNNEEIRNNNSTQYEWGLRNGKYYSLDEPVWQPDHWVGEMSFKQMLSNYGVELLLKTNFKEGSEGVVTGLDHSGLRRMTALLLENGDTVQGKYFIDTSYEGELMTATGHISYTFGREGMDEYHESLAGVTDSSLGQFPVPVDPYSWSDPTKLLKYIQDGPDPRKVVGQPDKNLMAYSFRACITQDTGNRVPYTEPPGYDPMDFELSRRLVYNDIEADNTPEAPWSNLVYSRYPSKAVNMSKYDACCGSAPVGIDAVGLAVGYANASRTERQRIYDAHRYYVQGLMWFWSTDPSVPDSIKESIKSYGLCKDEWPENGHFPPQLYVRKAARMVGDKVFSQQDRVAANTSEGCLEDAIALAEWGYDVHGMQRVAVTSSDSCEPIVFNEGLTPASDDGFYIYELPYYVILPKREEMVNLAVPNCPSVSHVAFSSIRVEPTLWQLGQGAGSAAGLAVKQGRSAPLQDLSVDEIQQALLSQGRGPSCTGHPGTSANCLGKVVVSLASSCRLLYFLHSYILYW